MPHLFTISTSDTSSLNGENPMLNAPPRRQFYRSHMLTLRSCSVNIGRLNSEVVRSMWASLSWELLYLTNDDDERYSIQVCMEFVFKNYWGRWNCLIFCSFHQPLTKNQPPNTKCQPLFLILSQFEKRRDSIASSLLKNCGNNKLMSADIWCFVFCF